MAHTTKNILFQIHFQSKRVIDLEIKVDTLTTDNRALADNLKQAKDHVASLSSQIVELKNKNEEFQRKEAIYQENHQSK